MPIVGFYCQKCRSNVPLNHFETCDSVHPDFATAVLVDSRRQRAEGIHVTSALGCPRRGALEANMPVYVDPLAYNAVLGGTAWHALMQAASSKPELCEVEVAGVINGVKLVGKIDRLHPPTAISDWKTTSDWSAKWLAKPKAEGGGMKTDHLAQLSLYAELVQQTQGWRPTHGIAWYRMPKEIQHYAEKLWDLQTVLDYKPVSGDFTVAELLGQLDHFAKWQAGRGAFRCEWMDLPVVGETQKYGNKTACDYCAVREPCWQQSKGAPF